MNFACHGNVIEISWISAGGQQQLWESRGISIRSSCRSHVGDPGSTGQPVRSSCRSHVGDPGSTGQVICMSQIWLVVAKKAWSFMEVAWFVSWNSHGLFSWISNGCPWICNGCPMDLQWLSHGFPMVVPWICNGCPMDCQWLSHGFPMVVPWISNGCPMGFAMISNGCPMLLQ